jgi:hypothetical protein
MIGALFFWLKLRNVTLLLGRVLTVGWIRSQRRPAALLALFALALQLAASFGHIHAEQLSRPVNVATLAAPTVPASDDQADHACDVCVTVAQLSVAHAPPPPALEAPAPSGTATFKASHDTTWPGGPFVHFRSRAPPLA